MKTLTNEVAAKYALIGIRPGKYVFKGFGEINLSQLSLAKADELYKKGFPFLKLKNGVSEQAPPVGTQKVRLIKTAKETGKIKGGISTPADVDTLRKNKKLINKLLSLEWKDLSDQERLIFFNEEYFTFKKGILIKVSETDRKMQSLHANLKAIATDEAKIEERGALMDELSQLEEQKLEAFGEIDTWKEPEVNTDPEDIKSQAAAEALKKQKLIDAHENFIYRNEPSLANMPEDTAAQKKKKAKKAAEIERRKKELIELGKPYQRKSRK